MVPDPDLEDLSVRAGISGGVATLGGAGGACGAVKSLRWRGVAAVIGSPGRASIDQTSTRNGKFGSSSGWPWLACS